MFRGAPVFISNRSGFDNDQTQTLNSLISSFYKYASEKVQKTKDESKISIKKTAGRVTDSVINRQDDLITVFLQVYIPNASQGDYVLVEISDLSDLSGEWDIQSTGYFDETLKIPLSTYGYVYLDGSILKLRLVDNPPAGNYVNIQVQMVKNEFSDLR